MNHDIKLSGHIYRINPKKDNPTHACTALKFQFGFCEERSEKPCPTKEYPIIFWIRTGYIKSSMEVLFNQINSN